MASSSAKSSAMDAESDPELDLLDPDDLDLTSASTEGPNPKADEKEKLEKKGAFKAAVYQALKSAKGIGGDFAISGELKQAPLCVIDIKDYGAVTFPMYQKQASQLIPFLELAPFGKGNQTVVDTTVRNSWQLDPTKFTMLNPLWEIFVDDEVVPLIVKGFELENTRVKASLYKFLLYEKGSFFKTHRDTEKEKGMFGTLIIQLPSDYEGGKLVVKHDGKTRNIDFCSSGQNKKNAFSSFYSALYCDCEHEILPLKKGYRSCLVYNLTSTGTEVVAPVFSATEKNLTKLLKSWPSLSQSKLVFVLSHKYSKVGLSFKNLKTTDKAVADLLRGISKKTGMVVSVGLLTKRVTGPAEDDGYDEDDGFGFGFGYGFGRNRYNKRARLTEYVHYTEDEFPATEYSFKVCDSTDKSLKTKDIGIDLLEVMPANCFDQIKTPDEIKYEGYQGNYAGELDHWYQLGAIVLYPSSNFLKIAKDVDFPQITVLKEFVKTAEKVKQKSKVLLIARDVLQCVKEGPFVDLELARRALKIIAGTGDLKLIQDFLKKFSTWPKAMAPVIRDICEQFGWDNLSQQLKDILKSIRDKSDAVEFIDTLLNDYPSSSGSKRTVLSSLCSSLLEQEFAKEVSRNYYANSRSLVFLGEPMTPADYNYASERKLFAAILRLSRKMNFGVVDFLKAKPNNKNNVNIFGPACMLVVDEGGASRIPETDPFLQAIVGQIVVQMISGASAIKESNYALADKIRCNTNCADCGQIQTFLSSNLPTFSAKWGVKRIKHVQGGNLGHVRSVKLEVSKNTTPHSLNLSKTHVAEQMKDLPAYKKLLEELGAKFPTLKVQLTPPSASASAAGSSPATTLTTSE